MYIINRVQPNNDPIIISMAHISVNLLVKLILEDETPIHKMQECYKWKLFCQNIPYFLNFLLSSTFMSFLS